MIIMAMKMLQGGYQSLRMQLDGVFDCCSMFLGPAFWILSSILWQLWQSTNLQFTLCSAPSSSGCCHQSVHNAVHQTPFFQISSIGSYFLCYFATKRHLMNFTLMRAPRASMKALPTSTTWIEIFFWCCLIYYVLICWFAESCWFSDKSNTCKKCLSTQVRFRLLLHIQQLGVSNAYSLLALQW